ncbi:MAG: hypothetical protein ACYSWT_07645 [Planctomycetota bacterium]|jgi:hypothetical protein
MDCRKRRRLCLLAGAGAVLAAGDFAAGQPAAARPPDTATETTADQPPTLASLRRELARFDFEEAERAPYTMPPNFYRHIAPDQGFPRFGRMQLTSESAHGGRWSFRFQLDGGSLSARVPTAVIPVLPGADYTVTAWIRTEGLTHAAARLVAQLYDTDRRPIAASRAQSRLLRTGGQWQEAAVEVYGDFEDAADLVVELQVLQPQQFTRPHEHPGAPLLEDVAGWAWFDDVSVRQLPRIELSTDVPGNVIVAPQTPILRAVVRDPTTERLSGRMLIYDVGGRPVSSTSFPLPQGSWRRSFDLADLEIGWYRAVLEVENPQQLVGRRSLDVVVLPARDRSPREQRFGIVLPSLETGGPVSVTRKLARHVGAAHALVPLWDDIESAPPVESAALRGTVEELLERGVEVTLVVPGLARKLARLPQPDPPAAGGAAEGGPTWLSALRHAAMTFGLGVPRWLIGAPGGAESLELVVGDQARLVLDAADRAMAGIVPQPVFLLPWPAEYEPVEAPVDRGFWMTVPYHVRPEALADYAAQWPVGDRPLFTTIERLPAGAYAPCDRAADLMLRGLYGWRAGLPRMAITAPWACRDHRAGTMPDPSFAAWRTLADQLDGRTFGGALPVADGIRCWILAGSAARDTALVAWSERAEPDAAVMRMLLAEGPVQVVDAFSGRRDVEPRDGVHTVDLGPRPLFIEGVDPGLAAFRAGFGIQPSFLTARHQVHECEMLLSNPWSNTITGTLRLQAPEGWRVTPRIHRFAVPPGQIEALPISVVMRPGAPTGGARIEGEVELIADRPYRLRVHANLNVGLENIEFAAHWRVDRNERTGTDDLIVTQTITNNGPRPVALYAYVSAPGMSRQRHPVGNLTPGQKTVQTFRLPDGARLLAGKRIRVGVIDDDGVRLNRIMAIPSLTEVVGADGS